jgi:hypothetical protein
MIEAPPKPGKASLRVRTLGLWVGPGPLSEKTPRRQGAEEALEGLQPKEMLGLQEPREPRIDLTGLDATPLGLMHACIGAHGALAKAPFPSMSAKRFSNRLACHDEEIVRK